MYVPPQHQSPDSARHLEIMRSYPLATLITGTDGVPEASHVPTIVWSQADDGGIVVRGHMNRANPQWKRLATTEQALLVFAGPHGYVSPVWYQVTPAAPTWDFVAVHARGTIRTLACPEETLAVIRATVSAYEALAGTQWDMTDSIGYFRQIMPAAGAFEVVVHDIQAMFKLSQEQRPEIQQEVACRFASTGLSMHFDLAEAIWDHMPAPLSVVRNGDEKQCNRSS
jgi:transcriptional regulator